jgi:hypothetical protein
MDPAGKLVGKKLKKYYLADADLNERPFCFFPLVSHDTTLLLFDLSLLALETPNINPPMKKLILVVSFLTLVGGLKLYAQPDHQPEGIPRGEDPAEFPREGTDIGVLATEKPTEMLPPEAIDIDPLKHILYPSWALRKNIQGEVKVRIKVDAEGRYMTHEIMRAPDVDLAAVVCEKIPYLRFSPAEVNQQPVEGWTAISVFFEIPENARGRQAGMVTVGYQK